MIREVLQIWLGDPSQKAITLQFPPELLSALDTLAFITNERRKALGSAPGGVDNWGLVTREELILEAVNSYLKQHLQVANPRMPVKSRQQGTGRIQRTV